MGVWSSGLLSTTKTKTTWESHSDTANGTTVGGDSVILNAGNDLTTRGANVVATNDVLLKAGNNIDIGAAKNTSHSFESTQTKSSGIFSDGGTGFTVGSKKQSSTVTTDAVTHTGSTIGSTDGAVTIVAGKDVTLTGSDILSNTGTAISGQNVTVQGATDTLEVTQTSKTSSSGVHVSLRGGAADVANALIGSAQGAAQANDPRLKALYAAQAAQTLLSNDKAGLNSIKKMDDNVKGIKTAADAAGNPNAKPEQKGASGGMSLRVGVGASSGSSTTTHSESTNVASNIQSNGDITVTARGDANGQGGDLTIQGSNVAANNVTLAANRDLVLKSATDTSSDIAKNTAKSGEIGFTMGSEAGYGIYVSASGAKGSGTGSSTTHQETQINAANTVTLSSGRDTTLEGAQVRGDTVLANIGNNLTITSQQDTDQYKRKDTSAGIDAAFGTGGGSVSANANQSRTNSDYKSVNEQSGIAAGSGGFNVNVGNHTQLNGGAIVSTADASKNTLSTQTLASTDLSNQSNFNASSVGFIAGAGTSGGGFTPSLGVPQSGDESSVTKSAISDSTVNIRSGDDAALAGIKRDQTDLHMQGLANTFDEQKIREAQEMGQLAGQVGFRAVGDLAKSITKTYDQAAVSAEAAKKILESRDATPEQKALAQVALDQATAIMAVEQSKYDLWKDGGIAKTLAHAAMGALVGDLGGASALTSALSAATAELGRPLSSGESSFIQSLISLGIGTAVGGQAGGSIALLAEQFNRQLHPTEQQWITDNAEEFAMLRFGCTQCSDEQIAAARDILFVQAAMNVDKIWSDQLTALGVTRDDQALNFLIEQGLRADGLTHASLKRYGWGMMFSASPEQFNNHDYLADKATSNPFHFVNFWNALDNAGVKPNGNDLEAYTSATRRQVTELNVHMANDAYRTMFVRPASVYEVVRDENNNLLAPRKLTDKDVSNLQPAADGKVHVALNGILNNVGAANKYANQHGNAGVDGPQYFVHFPKSEFTANDLVISGYMKYFDGGVMPLTNSTKVARDIMWQYGDTGLQIDAHSRGTMTAYNGILALPNNSQLLSATTIRFFGPAANVAAADAALASRQGLNEFGIRSGTPITYQAHKDDFVGTLIGGNPSTGGTTPTGSSPAEEAVKILTKKYTPHNCYGQNARVECIPYWNDTRNKKGKYNGPPNDD